jgi:uroporphyrinogen-III synthase
VNGLAGLRIGVSAGRRGPELVDALARLGALPVWAPLGEVDPHRRGVAAAVLLRAMCDAELDALAFTSPPAVDGLFSKAAELGIERQVHDVLSGRALTGPAAGRVLVAALCPATAETLERRGVGVVVCPMQPRIAALAGALVAAPIGFRSFGRVEPLQLDPQSRIVTGPGGTAELSDLQFALLAALARRPGLTCPPGVLLREVWGDGPSVGAGARRRLEVLVSRLRARLAPIQVNLATVPKRGYRLELAARTTLGADEGPGAR